MSTARVHIICHVIRLSSRSQCGAVEVPDVVVVDEQVVRRSSPFSCTLVDGFGRSTNMCYVCVRVCQLRGIGDQNVDAEGFDVEFDV